MAFQMPLRSVPSGLANTLPSHTLKGPISRSILLGRSHFGTVASFTTTTTKSAPWTPSTTSKPPYSLSSSSTVRGICTSIPLRKVAASNKTDHHPPIKEDEEGHVPEASPLTDYKFEDIAELSRRPDPNRILIDVRESSELADTGRIPTAHNLPLSIAADAITSLTDQEFQERLGFARPGPQQEVIFYCLGGVRSLMTARMARDARFGGRVGNYQGSWEDWVHKGGEQAK